MTQELEKVFLAIGMESMENFLKEKLSNEFHFAGEAIYREGVVNNALQCNPDIIILRETLNGSKNILDVVYDIRLQLPDTRIIFLASDRKPGDPLLAELVGNGVYDILIGTRISFNELVQLMRTPNKFSDVAIYRPKATFDKDSNELLFEAPPIKEVVKTVTQTVYVESEPIHTQDKSESISKIEKEEKEEEKPVEKMEENKKNIKNKKGKRKFFGFGSTEKKEELEENKKDSSQMDITDKIEEIEKKTETIPPTSTKVDTPVTLTEPIVEKPLQPSIIIEEQNRIRQEAFLQKATEPQTEPIIQKTPVKKQETLQNPKVNREEKEDKPISTKLKKHNGFISINNKQKILTFVGGEHGVGNTQIAHNTALALGKQQFKTIFIELKEEGSTIEYLYQLFLLDKGVDYALQHLQEGNLAQLHNCIIRVKEVQEANKNHLLETTYKALSPNVDYLFFSPDYILEENRESKIDAFYLKELCMHLLFQEGYQYIVLDVEPKLFNPFTEVALGFGTHIFFTLTQDVYHIGRAVRNISEINKRINIIPKLYYIINKFDEQAELSRKDIEDWLKSDVEAVIPNLHKEFINANMNGLPALSSIKNRHLSKAFDMLVQHILMK